MPPCNNTAQDDLLNCESSQFTKPTDLEKARSMSKDQEMYEGNTHVFMVKIWLEESVDESGRAVWRGYITHLPDGERRHIQDLDEMFDFIITYLKRMGVRRGLPERLWSYFRLKKSSKK
jgi:hypothetical protein